MKLQAFAPAGWKVAAATPVTLGPGATQALSLPVNLPPVVESGPGFIDVQVRSDQDELLDTNFAAFTMPATVDLQPGPALVSETTKEGALLKLTLTNTTAKPLSGKAAAYLEGLPPLPQDFGPLAAGQIATISWRAPGVDLAAKHWTADYEVIAEGVRSHARKDLWGQNWSVVGPFPRGFDSAEGPEKKMKFDPAETFTDMMGNDRKWQVVRPAADGLINLADAIKPNTEVMAYACTVVTSPHAQKALFSVGTDDGGKGWLNGKLIFADDGTHAAVPGQQQVPVELAEGRNEVWLKVTQSTGGWGFYFDLLDPQSGKPLSLLYSEK